MRTKFLKFFFIFILCTGTSYPLSVFAKDSISIETTLSQKELAVIAFFRLVGTSPDYEAWIKSTSDYHTLQTDKLKSDFLIKESLRLGYGYGNYNTAKGLLKFSTQVIANYTPPSGDKNAYFHFRFPDQQNESVPVFSYPYGKESVVLILNKFAMFSNIPLNEPQYNKVLSVMPHTDEEYMAQLKIEVRPIRADFEKPVVINNKNQWMMLGEIAYMQCDIVDPRSSRKVKLWEYVAPWFEEEYNDRFKTEEEKVPHPFDLFKEEE